MLVFPLKKNVMKLLELGRLLSRRLQPHLRTLLKLWVRHNSLRTRLLCGLIVCILVFSFFSLFQPRRAKAEITFGAIGSITATSDNSFSVAYPSGISAGDMLVLLVANKQPQNSSHSTPSGWTAPANYHAVTSDIAGAADQGNVEMLVFLKEADGTESGSATVSIGGNNVSYAAIARYSKSPGTIWSYSLSQGIDITEGTSWSVSGNVDPGIEPGDIIVAASAINTDGRTFSSQAVTSPGVTFTDNNERHDGGSSVGQDIGMVVSDHVASIGASSGNPTYTMTANGSGTNNPLGGTVLIRLRAQFPAPLLNQAAFRWYANADNVQPGTALTGENATALSKTSAPVRLRMGVDTSINDLLAASQQYKLQYTTDVNGSWTDVASGIWYDPEWSSRRKITLDNSASSENLIDFPIRVSLTSNEIDYDKTKNNGEDIRFVDGDGTLLSHEIEVWDENGASEVWVKVPQIDAGSTTDFIWMYYGNAEASDGQNANDVWSNGYAGVYHMNQDPSGSAPQILDSTTNGRHGTSAGSMTSGDLVAGQIGFGIDFDGSNDAIQISGLMDSPSQLTMSAWISADGLGSSDYSDIVSLGDHAFIRMEDSGILSEYYYGSDWHDLWAEKDTLNLGFIHIAAAFSPSTSRQQLVVNGGLEDTTAHNNAINWSGLGSNTFIGRQGNGSSSYYTNGVIDEVRFASIARSADWMTAEYKSMANTMNTIGGEEVPAEWKYYDNPSVNDGATISTALLSGDPVPQSYNESHPTVTNPNQVTAGDRTEWDFALDPADAAADTTYYFRIVKENGAPLDAYSRYASIYISNATFDQSAYRWFENDNTESGVEDWYNASWAKRKLITIDSAKVPSAQTDFPVLIHLASDGDLAASAQNDADDILFTTADGQTKLSHEIETYNAGTGELVAWVKVPMLSSDTDTVLHMYYGNALAANQENASDVWSNGYAAVWHMAEDPSSSVDGACGGGTVEVCDSKNSNHLDSIGMDADDLIAGKINGATRFNSNTEYLSAPSDPSLEGFSELTLSAWINPTADPGSDDGRIIHKSQGLTSDDYHIAYDGAGAGKYGINFRISTDNKTTTAASNLTIAPNSGWHYVQGVWDGSNMTIYINGSNDSGNANTGTLTNSSEGLGIGRHVNSDTRNFNGHIDEPRVSSVVRSADWITTEYNNQGSPETFYAISDEEEQNLDWYNPDWSARRKITLDNAASGEHLLDFPIRVSLTSDEIDYAKTKANGEDIRFVDGDGTLLSHEIETWNEGGTSEVWVKIPQIDAGSTTDYIWMYYGNPSASDGQNASDVWSNGYVGVWHLNEDLTGACTGTKEVCDSSSSANHADADAGMTPDDSVSGKIGTAMDFDGGSTDIIEAGANNIPSSTAQKTISAWFKYSSLPSTAQQVVSIFDGSGSGTFNGSHTLTGCSGASWGTWRFGGPWLACGAQPSTGTWHHHTYTFNGTNNTLYVDGSFIQTTTQAPNAAATPTRVGIGFYRNTSNLPREVFEGQIDEVRIETIARSADWIEAQYNTMNNTMNTFGNEEYYGLAQVGTPLADQDTATTAPAQGTPFRLRMTMHVGNGQLSAGTGSFKLQYAERADSCDTSFIGESYSDVATDTGTIRYYDNSNLTDNMPLLSHADDPVHAEHTTINQAYEEANNLTNIATISSGEDGMWDFALVDHAASAGTTYCFRIVKSDATLLDSYTVIAEITTASDSSNTAPNDPLILSQKKTDDTNLTVGQWVSDTSIKFTATADDADETDTLYLCVEADHISTAFSNTEDECGEGVAFSGTEVSVSVTLNDLDDAQEYHWQVRIKDASGAYSAWVSYGNNQESDRDFGLDTTAPTGGNVYDGANAGIDIEFNDGSLSSLSANWANFNADASGLQKYQYAIGTTVGGTDIKDWTDHGTNTSITVSDLTLHTSQIYYVSVRVHDNAGNYSTVTSDGQVVEPSLDFSISSSNATFTNLNAGNSYTATTSTTLTTSTNAYNGYTVRAFASGNLADAAGREIGMFDGGTYENPDGWQGGDTGFGYTSNDTTIQGINKFSPATCAGGNSPPCYSPFTISSPGDIVADHTSLVTGTSIVNEEFVITYRVTTSALQASGVYSNAIIYTIQALY